MMRNSKDVSLPNSTSSSPSPASSSSSPPFSTSPSVEAEAGSGRAVGMERSAQDLPNTGAESNTDAAKKLRRKPCCFFCRNHLKTVPVINHNCPYATCMCIFCDLTRRRREVMRHQQRLWRFKKELASSNPNQRNWRGIIIAVLVIFFVLGMIVTSVLLLTPPDDGPRVKGRRFELEDILGDDFKIHTFNGTWVSAAAPPGAATKDMPDVLATLPTIPEEQEEQPGPER